METISNAATAASKMIWGEQNTQSNETAGKEPISGEQGKGTINEPYDQGNSENPTSTSNNPPSTLSEDPTSTSSTSNNPSSTLSDDPTSTSSTSNNPSSILSEDPTSASSTSNNPSSTMSETTTSSGVPKNPANAAAGGPPRPEHETEKTGVVGGMSNPSKGSDVVPSESAANPGAAPSSGAAPEHKQQGADKPFGAPSGEEESAVKDKKDDAEKALHKRDPNDHSGEPMKMHGGEEIPKTQEERRSSKVGMPGGQEHGKPSKGTGEQYVKTTGMAVDGGDFDVTKPGAGREADRLMEEKGIQKSSPGEPTPPQPSGSETKEKVPLGEKIKTKLHIGHKDK